jgi:hypothetical protein
MKLTKSQLKQIIKEELDLLLNEQEEVSEEGKWLEKVDKMIQKWPQVKKSADLSQDCGLIYRYRREARTLMRQTRTPEPKAANKMRLWLAGEVTPEYKKCKSKHK